MSGGTWHARRKPPQSVFEWESRIWSAPVPHGCRNMLLLLARHMTADRMVSVPRTRLAAELDVHVSRISGWVGIAIEAGYLVCVSPGSPGRTSIYQGTRPDRGATDKGAECAPERGAEKLTR